MTQRHAGRPAVATIARRVAAAGIVALAGCGHGARALGTTATSLVTGAPTDATVAPQQGQAASFIASVLAMRAGGALLTGQRLPAGVALRARAPGWTQGLLDRPPPAEAFAHSVDRHEIGVADLSANAMLAFVSAHPPAGGRLLRTGSDERRGRTHYRFVEYDVPSATRELGPQRLTVAVASDEAHELALRVDARVAWRVARPAGSTIPVGARYLTAVVAPPTTSGGRTMGRPVGPRRHLSGSRAVARVVRAIDDLPLAEPAGPPPSCPPQDGELYVWLELRASVGGRVLARVQVDPYDCGAATVWVEPHDGRRVALGGARSALGALERALGAKLPGLPREG